MSDTSLTGKAKELFVATVLVGRKLHVYFPLVDNGFDLLVTSPDGARFIPVQVKYKAERSGFSLKRTDAERFAQVDAVLAFGSDEADEKSFFFFPAAEWLREAESHDRLRGDDKLVVYMSRSGDWIERYRGRNGFELAFARVLSARG